MGKGMGGVKEAWGKCGRVYGGECGKLRWGVGIGEGRGVGKGKWVV